MYTKQCRDIGIFRLRMKAPLRPTALQSTKEMKDLVRDGGEAVVDLMEKMFGTLQTSPLRGFVQVRFRGLRVFPGH